MCGIGLFGNSESMNCEMCDATVCRECKGTDNFCIVCTDPNKKVSPLDGTCVATVQEVNCLTHQFKSPAGLCLECHHSCDRTAGCTGQGNSKCKLCNSESKAVNTIALGNGSTVYKCAEKCRMLSEEVTMNGQQVCKMCAMSETMKVFDYTTKTCIAETDGCPVGSVLTTLNMLTDEDDSDVGSYQGDASMIKVCAKCDGRCKTCSPQDTKKCLT